MAFSLYLRSGWGRTNAPRRTMKLPFIASRSKRRTRRARSSVELKLEVLEARFLPSLTPHLLKDINPGSGSSGPAAFVQVNGVAFFAASDGVHGMELWKSNGTGAGTVLVKDIRPGSSDSYPGALT